MSIIQYLRDSQLVNFKWVEIKLILFDEYGDFKLSNKTTAQLR